MKSTDDNKPTSPGEFLREGVLVELDLTPQELALALGVTTRDAYALMADRQPLELSHCLRLEHLTQIPRQFWMNLQIEYELWEGSHILIKISEATEI